MLIRPPKYNFITLKEKVYIGEKGGSVLYNADRRSNCYRITCILRKEMFHGYCCLPALPKKKKNKGGAGCSAGILYCILYSSSNIKKYTDRRSTTRDASRR